MTDKLFMDVKDWQNVIMQEMDKNGNEHKSSYLSTIHTQLSCILNHAVRFYGLKNNPARLAGGMGTKKIVKCFFGRKKNTSYLAGPPDKGMQLLR